MTREEFIAEFLRENPGWTFNGERLVQVIQRGSGHRVTRFEESFAVVAYPSDPTGWMTCDYRSRGLML